MKGVFAAGVAVVVAAGACGGGGKRVATERTTPGVGLTVYTDWAVVKDWRTIRLDAAGGEVRVTGVPRLIDPTTVSFRSVTDPSATVLEQSYEHDLVSADKLLAKHVDGKITLLLAGGKKVSGKLLAFDAARIVLDTGDATTPIEIVERARQVKGIELGGMGDLLTKPTLVWLVAGKTGEQLVKVTYQTAGFSWEADYTAVVKDDGAALDLSGWVTIVNASGASYPDAELKLVAGEVNRVRPVALGSVTDDRDAPAAEEAQSSAPPGFVEKAFFEYHLYTLGRRTTIPDASVKQIEMFDPVSAIPSKKVFVYEGLGAGWASGTLYTDRAHGTVGNKKVDVYLELKNDARSKLGMPLPAGRVRVYQLDAGDGSLELVGEDRIDHTPKDEEVRLRLGNAFDVVGERKQTEWRADVQAHWIEETIEVRLRNHKDTDIEVLVREPLYRWSTWKITAQSDASTKEAAQLIQFRVQVPKGGEKVLNYTVRYSWLACCRVTSG